MTLSLGAESDSLPSVTITDVSVRQSGEDFPRESVFTAGKFLQVLNNELLLCSAGFRYRKR